MIVAAANADDARHADARRILRSVVAGRHGAPVTSDYVLAEAFNFLRQRVPGRRVADEARGIVFGRPGVRPLTEDVLRVSGPVFAASLERYLGTWPARLSFTDWTSLLLMEERGVGSIATFDRGFARWARVVD